MSLMQILPVIDKTDGVQDAAMCRECGGGCCKSMPGIAYPSDFGPRETLVATLLTYLRSGKWAIDWWEGDIVEGGPLPCIYWIRPATVMGAGKLFDASWGGQCSLWTEKYGCGLPFRQRPYQCRNLKPRPMPEREKSGCEGDGKEEAAHAWRDYQEEIKQAAAIIDSERWRT